MQSFKLKDGFENSNPKLTVQGFHLSEPLLEPLSVLTRWFYLSAAKKSGQYMEPLSHFSSQTKIVKICKH